MTFPIGAVAATDNLLSGDNDPNLARVDLLYVVNLLNQIIASANVAQGLCVLDTSGQIKVSQVPTSWNTTGTLTFQPTGKIVAVRDILRLTQVYVADLPSYAGDLQLGDTVFLVDGDAGQPCLSVYDGTDWRVVRLMTTVSAVGATLSAVSALACIVD